MKRQTVLFLALAPFMAVAQRRDTLVKRDSLKVDLLEVVIEGNQLNQRSSVSEIVLNSQTLKTNHGLLEDPLRVVSAMPGVSRGGDLFSPTQVYVRGGAPEENLYLNNNAKIYFPFYFGGQKSVFNSDVIESVELLTGGFTAKYGNALSSVLNVNTRDGNRAGYSGLFSLGFYNSSVMAEGPIGKNASFIVSGRRTYLDLAMDESAEFPVPEFGDVTYKVTLFDKQKHKIMLSGLSGYEKLDFLAANPVPGTPDRLETAGGSDSQSLQWQYTGEKVFSKLSLVNTRQKNTAIVSRNFNLKVRGTQTGLREDFEYKYSKKLLLQTGFEAYYNDVVFNSTLPLDPREADPTDTNVRLVKIGFNENDSRVGSWASARLSLTNSFGLSAGIRHDYTDAGDLSTLAPRLSAYYSINKSTEARVAYTYNYQFPAAEMVSRNPKLRSPLCIHHIAGIQHRFSSKALSWIEIYDKEYSRLVTYDSALAYANNGAGYARGVELFLRQEFSQLTGWVSYAYSIAKRRSNFDDKEYYFDYDQRHIANLSVQYKINRKPKKWYIPVLLNAQVRTESGRPYTPVNGARLTPGGWRLIKGEINSKREPYYLNVNFRVEWNILAGKRVKIMTYFDIWNLLNRKNILGRTFQYGPQYPDNVNIQEYYVTPVLPAGGIRVEFNQRSPSK